MVLTLPVPPAVHWTVQLGPVTDAADANSKALAYMAANPGLRWLGSWKAIRDGRLTEIEVSSEGSIVVSVGSTSDSRDAKSKTELFLRKKPYLKWIGDCTAAGWHESFEILVEPYLPSQWPMQGGTEGSCLPVQMQLKIKNATPEAVTRVVAWVLDEEDWGARSPCRQLTGCRIEASQSLQRQLDLNFWHWSAQFGLRLKFQTGRWLECEVNGRISIDSAAEKSWSCRSDLPGLSACPLPHPDSQLLELLAVPECV